MKKIETRELQLLKLELLKQIDKICRECGIRYYLAYGTLLGAIREQGYIMWDEDIDIWMPRTDYNKFCEIAKSRLCDKYFLQNYETDLDLVHAITRICLNGTYRCEESYKACRFNKGSFIDIFPLDIVPDDDIKRNKMYDRCKHYEQILRLKYSIPQSNSFFKLQIRRLIKALLKLCNEKTIYKKYLKELTAYENTESTLVGCPCIIVPDRRRVVYEKKNFDGIILGKFEGLELPCPSGYDNLLTQLYGNYMIPPEEKDRKIDCPTFYTD